MFWQEPVIPECNHDKRKGTLIRKLWSGGWAGSTLCDLSSGLSHTLSVLPQSRDLDDRGRQLVDSRGAVPAGIPVLELLEEKRPGSWRYHRQRRRTTPAVGICDRTVHPGQSKKGTHSAGHGGQYLRLSQTSCERL